MSFDCAKIRKLPLIVLLATMCSSPACTVLERGDGRAAYLKWGQRLSHEDIDYWLEDIRVTRAAGTEFSAWFERASRWQGRLRTGLPGRRQPERPNLVAFWTCKSWDQLSAELYAAKSTCFVRHLVTK